QPKNLATPKGKARSTPTGITKIAVTTPPSQKQRQGVWSRRRRARSTVAGNNSHQAVSNPGKARPRINKMPKTAVMLAMKKSFQCVIERITGRTEEKLQEN